MHETMPAENSRKIAKLGTIMADETRVQLLRLLLETHATTSELVVRLGLDQPRVSAHLAALRRSGLVSVSVAGRQHVYALRTDGVADAIRSFFHLASLSLPSPPGKSGRISRTAIREVGRDSSVRRARTCYDHLAGVAGVELLDQMLRRGWVVQSNVTGGPRRTTFKLTDKGRKSLQRLNVQLEETRGSKRLFAYGCLDWTERRYHLGGSLGKAVLDSLLAERIVEKTGQRNGSRAVTVRKPIVRWIATNQGTTN
jgi:DNA-binding transcriptional ArsR family regulator